MSRVCRAHGVLGQQGMYERELDMHRWTDCHMMDWRLALTCEVVHETRHHEDRRARVWGKEAGKLRRQRDIVGLDRRVGQEGTASSPLKQKKHISRAGEGNRKLEDITLNFERRKS